MGYFLQILNIVCQRVSLEKVRKNLRKNALEVIVAILRLKMNDDAQRNKIKSLEVDVEIAAQSAVSGPSMNRKTASAQGLGSHMGSRASETKSVIIIEPLNNKERFLVTQCEYTRQ